MKIETIMHRTVWTCRHDDTLTRAAQLMWDHDVGALPVVDDQERLVGMITDRDICMAAYTTGCALGDLKVNQAMAGDVVTCTPEDSDEAVARLMATAQIRRVPVVDRERKPQGIVTVNDLAHAKQQGQGVSAETVTTTIAAVTEPRPGSELATEATRSDE
jgi:CBS-domain-containing membrane protein